MLAGLVAPFLLGRLTPIAWTWNVAIGATVTFAVGSLVSAAARR
jgi:hypothetical protein